MSDIQELIPVEGHTHLGRDPHSNAIVNMDKTGYQAYVEARERNQKRDTEISDLKSEINELKDLVNQLLEKNK